jgi:transketolase
MGAALFSESLSFNPEQPRWINRDRFILSAGHGSMFLYGWLNLSGFDISIEDIKAFRQLHSKTPGHPEFMETPGVECTSGPLGQGIGNAVGFAISQKMAAEKFNTEDHTILDNHVICLAGDGCFQEGVAMEASALAGHIGLDNLIIIFDSNDVTLDAMADVSQSEDVAKRYEAIGFNVCTIDGHNMDAVAEAVAGAKASDNGKPNLIIAKTEIGRGVKEVAGTNKAHGEGGAKFADTARPELGLPEELFHVSDDVREFFAERKAEKLSQYAEWEAIYNAWKAANPEAASLLESAAAGERPSAEQCLQWIPEFDADASLPTRGASGKVLQRYCPC